MKLSLPIYMDGHSTTPVDPRVLEAMLPAFHENFGNAASRHHAFGWLAERLVEEARAKVAHLIGAEAEDIVFTSGATEAINLGIKGAARMYRERGNHLITCVTEHRAVLDTCRALEREGFEVTYLPVEPDGRIALGRLEAAVKPSTILIAIMHANNEIGVIQPVEGIGKIVRERGIIFFSDATQSVGKIPVDVNRMHMDLLCLSAHKFYGPKGVGALYVRSKKPRVRLAPILDGGGHERGLRSGTLNVPGIVGLGKACELSGAEMTEESGRLKRLRDKLVRGITSALSNVYVNGSMEFRLPHNANVSFAYVEGESLLSALSEDVAVSSGSACSSATLEPSYVLKALGMGEDLTHSSVRFGLGRFNAEEEVDFVIGKVVTAVNHLRKLSPVYDMVKLQTENHARRTGTA